MAATEIKVQMQQRRDTAAGWTSADPTLLNGEIGYETDTGYIKIGDGSTAWASLAYVNATKVSAYPLATVDIADDSITGDKLANDITIAGNLTVNGTTTTVNSTTLTVDDKNIELGSVDTPTDVTADGGGITLKGATDHTIVWTNSTDSWDFSEHVDIASGKEFRIAGTKVLDATSLGSAVVTSSLTSVGTIATGVWNGTAIATDYIADNAVTYAKIQDVSATDKILGRSTAGAGVVEEISCTSAGRALLDDADASAQRTTLGLAIGTDVQAYDADNAVTDTAQTFTKAQRGSISAISIAASDTTKTLDFNTANNFALTLANTSSCTLANPSNLTAGQSGSIFVVQDSTGSRLLTYGSQWDFAGGSAPVLSTAGDSIDRIDYIVRSTSSIHAVFTAAYS